MGHWKNYEELEDNLSMPEMIKTLEAMHKKDERDKKFMASLQGVNLGEGSEEFSSFEDVERRVAGITTNGNDVVSLQGSFAERAGFGIGMGLGYNKIDG